MQFFDSPHRRRLIAGGAAVVALGLGGAGAAIAKSGGDHSPAYTSSVTVADSGTESSANDAALAAAAKITPDQAKTAALAAVPGTAGKVELDNENGSVVFGVEVTNAAGARTDVKVDAGNGKVLAQEAGDANESDAGGAADGESTTDVAPPGPQSTGK